MVLKRFALLLAGLGALALTRAQTVPVIPYDSIMEDRVGIDGEIDNEDGPEYPATFLDKASGLTVHWGFDDSLIYVGLQTKGRGWIGIGFGSAKMDESNMIVGYYSEDSTDVLNQVGVNHKLVRSPQSDSAIREAEIDFDEETGITTMEFIYPLKFPGVNGIAIPGLEPGDTYDVVLAQNTKTVSLDAKPTNQSALKVKLADNPHLKKQE
ncbi:MAG: DOMON domain-containing protein [candidate division WOR-3 bacterium]|nr:DOMON domain-containing protein [candidate division WOR-3 bacterium]